MRLPGRAALGSVETDKVTEAKQIEQEDAWLSLPRRKRALPAFDSIALCSIGHLGLPDSLRASILPFIVGRSVQTEPD